MRDRCHRPGWERMPGANGMKGVEIIPVLRDFAVLNTSGPCCVCQQVTHWAELNFIGYLHPGQCERSMWMDYRAAMRE